MFDVGIAFVCFYYAERVLSAIAKFLVHQIGEGEVRSEIGERSGMGRVWGENGEGMKIRQMRLHEKCPNMQRIWHLGTPLGDTTRCHTFLKSSFPGQHFRRRQYAWTGASAIIQNTLNLCGDFLTIVNF